MEMQEKIDLLTKKLSLDIDSKRAKIIEMVNDKEYFDIPGIMRQCEGLNILFNQLLQLQDLSENKSSKSMIYSETNIMNRQNVTNHRVSLRLKRLFYKSRIAFWQKPSNNKLIVATQQKMNRLLKSWKSAKVTESSENNSKGGFELSNGLKSKA